MEDSSEITIQDPEVPGKRALYTGITNIALDELEIYGSRRLGGGSSGSVFRGRWRGKIVAVKILNDAGNPDDVRQLEEALIQRQLDHPNVLRLYGCCTDAQKEEQYLIMEYMPKGSLRKVLQTENLSWFTKEQIALETAQALAYLHNKDVAHRDLKSLNVLLDDNYQAKVCDFGISTTRSASSVGSTFGNKNGTKRWMAPEAFLEGEKTGKQLQRTDICALGIIMWELCTQELPCEKSEYRVSDDCPQRTGNYPMEFVKLAKQCCRINQEERPSAQNVVENFVKYLMISLEAYFPRVYRHRI